jgi:outer membrane protein W
MNKYHTTLPILFVCSALVASAAVRQGMREIGISASYQNNNVDIDLGTDPDFDVNWDGDQFSFSGSYGYFFTDRWQGTLFATYQQMDFGHGGTDSLYLGGAVDYHFMPESAMVPYVGVGGAYGSIDVGDLPDEVRNLSDDDFVIQLRAGVKQFITESIAVRYQIEWNQGENTESLGASLGLATYF